MNGTLRAVTGAVDMEPRAPILGRAAVNLDVYPEAAAAAPPPAQRPSAAEWLVVSPPAPKLSAVCSSDRAEAQKTGFLTD